MFDHVTIRASDRAASERFYDTVLRTLGAERTLSGDDFTEWGDFGLAQADGGNPVTRRLHIGFTARSREQVDEFWRVGTEAGYRDDGLPDRDEDDQAVALENACGIASASRSSRPCRRAGAAAGSSCARRPRSSSRRSRRTSTRSRRA